MPGVKPVARLCAMTRQPKFDLHAGTTSLYLDPTYYDYEYKDRSADVRWYCDRYKDAGGTVLELGVGTGRIALRAAKAGTRIVGLDLSETMLAQAAERRAALPKKAQGNLELDTSNGSILLDLGSAWQGTVTQAACDVTAAGIGDMAAQASSSSRRRS